MTSEPAPMCTCGRRYEVIEQWGHEPSCPVATWIPPTKRTHGPCTCGTGLDVLHKADCPSIYPAQQERDALTRLVRTVRALEPYTNHEKATELMEQALALISEAQEEQRKSVAQARNDGLEKAARHVDGIYMDAPLGSEKKAIAASLLVELRALKDSAP